jgi:putative ABC transport system permease protein
MLRNFLNIAVRNIARHSSYTIVNVSGLALGIACGVLIFSLVSYHLSFDNFHPDRDRIYKIVTEEHRDDVSYTPHVPNPLGKVFREEHTFAEKVARIATFGDKLIMIENNGQVSKYREEEVAFAEPEFFEIFHYPLVEGNFTTALHTPNSAILTESLAKKYFGTERAIGKTFRLDNRINFTVTGVLRDFPSNSEKQTQLYFSYATVKDYEAWFADDNAWGGITSSMQCFARLKPGVTPTEVENVLAPYVKKYRPTHKNVHHYKLQPLREVHFDAQYNGPMPKRTLWIISIIGFFLIITACVNAINLSTAQAFQRSKEVGVRKVLGSMRAQLFWQFIMETAILTLIATVVALGTAQTILPFINEWFDSRISINFFSDWQLPVFVISTMLLVTFLSGSYPGLILSKFRPVLALKGKTSQRGMPGFNLRRGLIVAQFTISQVLMIGLIVIAYQMRYTKETDMGFDREAIVMVPVGSHDEKMHSLRHQLGSLPGVQKISLCYAAPVSQNNWGTSLVFENNSEEENFSISFKGGDENYLSTFDLELVAGRNLEPSDTAREFLVNETLVKKLNLASPDDILGRKMSVSRGTYQGLVVGVVKDFHDKSLHSEIGPVFMTTAGEKYDYYAVKINLNNAKSTLAALDKTWSATYPEQIYQYTFLEEEIAEFYETEITMMRLVEIFSGIAILIGCMGLYGLVSFMVAQKTKEIGIRKVLGSSLSQILWIFGREFFALILTAFLLAAPVGWWSMKQWLEGFEYHVSLDFWIFALAVSATTLVALVTICYRAMKVALLNPVKSLRTE